jgi:NADH dehydrogenase (ubiquinone) Fe-S protein 4
MKKVKIYQPTKTAMQSGLGNTKLWILEFETTDNGTNSLMGWESSTDTMSEVKLEFSSKEIAIEYATNNNLDYNVLESQKKKLVKKSYSDNFTK